MWPVEFIQCYLEDSFGARLWCDDSSVAVRLFVAQLLTFFSNDDSAPTRYADTSSRAPIVQYVIDQSRYVLEHDLTALPAVLKTLTPLAGVGAVRELAALHLRAWLRDTPPLAALARTLALAMLGATSAPPMPLLFQLVGEQAFDAAALDVALRRCVGASAAAAAMALEVAFSAGDAQRLLLLRATEALSARGVAVEPLLARHLCQSALSLCDDDDDDDDDESLMRLARGRRQLYALLAMLVGELDVAALCYALLDDGGGGGGSTYAETVARCATWALLLRAHALPPQQHAAFKQTVALVQSHAMAWCHKSVSATDGSLALLVRRLLFVLPDGGGAAAYFPDSSLGAAAQSSALSIVTDGVPLLEATLVHLIVMRLSHRPVSADDVVGAVEALVTRAAASVEPPPALASYEQLIDGLINVCETSASLLWRVVLTLTVLGALHPETVGGFLWRAVPTVGAVMRSMLTQRWQIGATPAADDASIVFERGTSLLLPSDTTRRHVLHLDATLRLSERLARCRAPDFVLDAAAAEPGDAAPWLARLLRANESLIDNVAPVCRCVALLDAAAAADDAELRRSLVNSLRTLLQSNNDVASTVEVLAFFLGQLSSPLGAARDAAVDCCAELFGGVEQLPRLPCYDSDAVRRVIGDTLASALAVEMSLERVRVYSDALTRANPTLMISKLLSQRPLLVSSQSLNNDNIDLDQWMMTTTTRRTSTLSNRFLFEL